MLVFVPVCRSVEACVREAHCYGCFDVKCEVPYGLISEPGAHHGHALHPTLPRLNLAPGNNVTRLQKNLL